MKLSRQKLRLMIENFLFENKANYEPKENWPAKRKKAEKDALYGDPKKRKDLKAKTKEDTPDKGQKIRDLDATIKETQKLIDAKATEVVSLSKILECNKKN